MTDKPSPHIAQKSPYAVEVEAGNAAATGVAEGGVPKRNGELIVCCCAAHAPSKALGTGSMDAPQASRMTLVLWRDALM